MLSKPITISNWSGGLADSKYQGIAGSHAMIYGCDIHSEPGILKIANRMEKVSGSTVIGPIKWFVDSSATDVYAIGGNSDSPHIYETGDAGATWSRYWPGIALSPGEGQGAMLWRGYLLLAGNSALDVINFGSDSERAGFQTLTSNADWHPMWMGKRDGSAYIGARNYIALLAETAGYDFNPNNAATYSFNGEALDIPVDFKVRSLEEVGNYLMLGCWETNTDTYGHMPTAIIYPWDYVLRPQSHEAPIDIRRMKGVSAQLNINNALYAFVGTRGELFYYNGSRLVKQEKFWKSTESMVLEVYPGAVRANYKDTILFGVSGSTGSDQIGGIYTYGSYDDKKYSKVVNIEYPLSLGRGVAYDIYAIHVCGTTDDVILASWNAGGTYGIDRMNRLKLCDWAYFESRLMRVGTSRNKAIVDGFEIVLDRPLSTGQEVRVKYRKSTNDEWTLGGTFSATLDGTENVSKYIPHKINNIVNLQVGCNFIVAGTDNELSIELKELSIK